ncbi:hypothetical protein GQ42DRAFT_156672 [Ramicandelaber brevisporus]|nr:hypothetical protein GQ42DRAFT_156672 [Ramicandelaber brevisporus]
MVTEIFNYRDGSLCEIEISIEDPSMLYIWHELYYFFWDAIPNDKSYCGPGMTCVDSYEDWAKQKSTKVLLLANWRDTLGGVFRALSEGKDVNLVNKGDEVWGDSWWIDPPLRTTATASSIQSSLNLCVIGCIAANIEIIAICTLSAYTPPGCKVGMVTAFCKDYCNGTKDYKPPVINNVND